ncbi:MAG: patatin-like phospholipase family protein [Bacteroidota bacterium]|nr:patatin-like phospholipase family protein [Bacteroidota bacterium]
MDVNTNLNNGLPLDPERSCDIVMKGGITSGIVYPKAIYEIAKKYKFVNIGGTSAGAIAASLTAAAEYDRRENKSINGFQILNNLPNELGVKTKGKTKLFSLFQPNKSTKKIFNSLFHLFEQKSYPGKIFFAIKSLILNFIFISVISALPGAIIIYYLWNNQVSALQLFAIFFVIFFSLVFVVLCTIIRFFFVFKKIICENNYGLTTGFLQKEENTGESSEVPLTEWLADLIDKVAGKNNPDEPLTFGDVAKKEGGINLQMLTTNLTWGRPHSIPFQNPDTENAFYYDPVELGRYFPKRIVAWMGKKSTGKKQGKFKLPEPANLPIIVATRMSLSFPVLFSAVPLYAVDYSLIKNKNDDDQELEKCFFSDGGICSNFPIHLFDSPLPSKPTFAFNLNHFHTDHPEVDDESKNIYIVKQNRDGGNEKWNKFNNSFMDFLKSILGTMQNWIDNTQSTIPGYKDRIVHINLTPKQGGLNLNMEDTVINRLSERGKYAGIELRNRFTGESKNKMNWNNHRWIRFRTTMCLLQEYLISIESSLNIQSTKYEKGYIDLLNRLADEEPASYKLKSSQRDFAIGQISEIRKIAQTLIHCKDSFFKESYAPRPKPDLRIRPRI